MDINFFIGLALAAIAIYFGAPDVRADLSVYLQLNSFIFVFGGMLGSTFISTSFKDISAVAKVINHMSLGKKFIGPKEAVGIMVRISELAQTGSQQQLLTEAEDKGDGFLKKALSMRASGLDKEFIDNTLNTAIYEAGKRHMKMIGIVRNMGTFAPMFGMAGTVIGVTQVLKNVTDIDNIVNGMALALLTTLYGLFLSSVVFIPIASKLKSKSEKELQAKEMIREGVMMIMDKEIPLKVEQYLSAYLDSSNQDEEEA
jgi:chemotaxis protein MotA